MISVVFSTREDNPKHKEHILVTSGIYKDIEVIQYINNGEYSLTEIYNKALKETTNDIVVFCHDDIILETKNWGNKILNHFKRNVFVFIRLMPTSSCLELDFIRKIFLFYAQIFIPMFVVATFSSTLMYFGNKSLN